LHEYGDTTHVVEAPAEKPNWSFNKPLEF